MDRQMGEVSECADRRSALRQGCRVQSLQVEHPSTGIFTATVLDISREGFRLLLPISVGCGDEILIYPPAGTQLLKIRATVVRQNLHVPEGEKLVECGAQVADTAAWRKHSWFLALRTGSAEYEATAARRIVKVVA